MNCNLETLWALHTREWKRECLLHLQQLYLDIFQIQQTYLAIRAQRADRLKRFETQIFAAYCKSFHYFWSQKKLSERRRFGLLIVVFPEHQNQ